MANQLRKFSTMSGELAALLRELLYKSATRFWDIAQEQTFADLKSKLQRTVELAPYSPYRDTVIDTDASNSVIEAALLQVWNDDEVRLF